MTATQTAAADEPRREHPSQEDELLRRARNPRTISSVPRRDVRNTISKIRGW